MGSEDQTRPNSEQCWGVCPSKDANPTWVTQPGTGWGLVVAEHVHTHRRGQQLILLYWDSVWAAEDQAAFSSSGIEGNPQSLQLITPLDFSI